MGMNAAVGWCALFALYGNWATTAMSDVDAGRIAVNRRDYLANLRALPEHARARWFELATWEVHDLQARIRRDFSIEQPRYWDVLPFEERPLVGFGDMIFCSSVPLLRRLPGSSIQHRLQDRAVFTEAETRRFRDTRGHLVERYTRDAFSRGFGARFLTEDDLHQYAGDEKVCDGIIVYADALVIVECKATSPLLDTRHAENYDRYRAQWAGTIVRAATQLVSTIKLLRAGKFEELGLSASVSWDLFPVVAVFEQPVLPLTYRTIRDVDLAGHALSSMIEARAVRPLQLLGIRDVDLWELAAESGRSVLDLLREKLAKPETLEVSFLQFVHSKGETFQERHSAWQAQHFREMMDAAMTYFKSLGLSDPSGGRESQGDVRAEEADTL